MNPLSLHLDRFLVRALQQRYFIRGKTVISLFIGVGAIFTSLFMKEDKNCMRLFFYLLAFGVKNEPHHSWNCPGDARQFKTKKALCAAVEMALFPIKQAAAAHERLYPYKECCLCRGSSGWEVNAKGCSRCCVSCRMSWCLSLQELLHFPFHSHLGRNTWLAVAGFGVQWWVK